MSIEDWLHLGLEARYLSASIQDFGDFRDLRKRLPAARPMCKKNAAQAAFQTHPATEKRAFCANF